MTAFNVLNAFMQVDVVRTYESKNSSQSDLNDLSLVNVFNCVEAIGGDSEPCGHSGHATGFGAVIASR